MEAKLGRLFDRVRWRCESRKGCMVRRCRFTGRREYRDCNRRAWIPLGDETDLADLRESLQYREDA